MVAKSAWSQMVGLIQKDPAAAGITLVMAGTAAAGGLMYLAPQKPVDEVVIQGSVWKEPRKPANAVPAASLSSLLVARLRGAPAKEAEKADSGPSGLEAAAIKAIQTASGKRPSAMGDAPADAPQVIPVESPGNLTLSGGEGTAPETLAPRPGFAESGGAGTDSFFAGGIKAAAVDEDGGPILAGTPAASAAASSAYVAQRRVERRVTALLMAQGPRNPSVRQDPVRTLHFRGAAASSAELARGLNRITAATRSADVSAGGGWAPAPAVDGGGAKDNGRPAGGGGAVAGGGAGGVAAQEAKPAAAEQQGNKKDNNKDKNWEEKADLEAWRLALRARAAAESWSASVLTPLHASESAASARAAETAAGAGASLDALEPRLGEMLGRLPAGSAAAVEGQELYDHLYAAEGFSARLAGAVARAEVMGAAAAPGAACSGAGAESGFAAQASAARTLWGLSVEASQLAAMAKGGLAALAAETAAVDSAAGQAVAAGGADAARTLTGVSRDLSVAVGRGRVDAAAPLPVDVSLAAAGAEVAAAAIAALVADINVSRPRIKDTPDLTRAVFAGTSAESESLIVKRDLKALTAMPTAFLERHGLVGESAARTEASLCSCYSALSDLAGGPEKFMPKPVAPVAPVVAVLAEGLGDRNGREIDWRRDHAHRGKQPNVQNRRMVPGY